MPETRKRPRAAVRNSIRTKIVTLLTVPIATLLTLWGFATYLTVIPALDLQRQRDEVQRGGAAASAMLSELQRERSLSVAFVARGRTGPGPLAAQRVRTDASLTQYHHVLSTGDEVAATAHARRALGEATGALATIDGGRQAVDTGQLDVIGVLRFFATVIDAQFRAFGAFPDRPSAELTTTVRAYVTLGRAAELLSQENTLLVDVGSGSISTPVLEELVQLIGARRFILAQAMPELPDESRRAYDQMAQAGGARTLIAIENAVLAQSAGTSRPAIDIAAWSGAYESVSSQFYDLIETQQRQEVAAYKPLTAKTTAEAVASGAVGLIAILVTVLLSVRIGRSLITRLVRLRREASDLAERHLPATVAKLRRSETVDLDAEAPPLDFGRDEIGRLGAAFNAVRRTALASAVEEARLRDGMNHVFLNIARRSQSLLHRQLAALDAMERRTTDPGELHELFRIDHMAARMRRHAEDLVILAGANPTRTRRKPAPMIEVLRGAVSEIETYQRVTIDATDDIDIQGPCVVDLIHLLAELLENATSFSPPHTPVHCTGQRVARGYTIEISDRGIGMTSDEMTSSNDRLASPPTLNPAESTRLGLFVVAHLAKRHDITVTLRTSPYGGLTAVVLLPNELLAEPAPGPPEPPVIAMRQRHAARAVTGADQHRRYAMRSPNTHASHLAADVATDDVATDDDPATESQAARSAFDDATRPADTESSAPDPLEGLPRRIRQASLDPRLRRAPGAPSAGAPQVAPAVSHEPEEVRMRMSLFQAGTLRGRAEPAVTPATAAEADPEAAQAAKTAESEDGR